jgi:hypothetical protein
MPRAGLLLVLAFSGCFFGAYAADLSCTGILEMTNAYLDCNIFDRPCSRSKANLADPWWNYGPDPRTYKNRYCDKCWLDQGSQDCKDNSCPFMAGPIGTAVDVLPSDSDTWICPQFCHNMPQIPIKFSMIKETSTWYCAQYWNWPAGVVVRRAVGARVRAGARLELAGGAGGTPGTVRAGEA